MTNNYLLIITGPTAIGKTDVALHINALLQSVIISADSRQVYKEMSIGTAKPSPKEIIEGNIKLADHISLSEEYNAGIFANEACEIIDHMHGQNKIPILCGGTGLYITAVTEGLHDFPSIDPGIRAHLNTQYEQEGIESLVSELKSKDPEYFEKADIQNPRRVIRALEVIRQTGRKYSDIILADKPRPDYKPVYVILELPREELYERINNRVDQMFENGLVEEVKNLLPYKSTKVLQTVGYVEVFNYLDGNGTLEMCKEEIKKNSRRYAKRQITWLSKYDTDQRFHPEDMPAILQYLSELGLKNI